MNTKKIILSICIAILIILGIFVFRSCPKGKTLNNLVNTNDSLIIYRNKLGQEVAEKSVLVGSVKDLQSKLLSKDVTISKLQKIVDKNTRTATVISTDTKDIGSTKTVISFPDSSKYINDTGKIIVKIYPKYSTQWEDKWSTGSIVAGRDSIYRNIKTHNEYSFRQEEKKRLFKSNTLTATWTNLNPNTTTKEFATFTLSEPKAYKGIWYSAGALTVFLIKLLFFNMK